MANPRGSVSYERLFDLATLRSSESFTQDAELLRIRQALERARAAQGQPLPEHLALPDYPGQTAELRVDGRLVGNHGLTLVDGEQSYVADLDVAGAALPLVITARGWFLRAVDERAALADFGPITRFGERDFDRRFAVRCRSRHQAGAFLTDEVIAALLRVGRDLVDVTLEPRGDHTHVRVRVHCGGVAGAPPAIHLARTAWAVAAAVAPAGFVPTSESTALDGAMLQKLVERVRDCTSFLAGSVEHVGDGVEARLELDQPADLAARLRVEVAGADGGLRMHFRGALPVAPRRPVRLSPEVGVLKKLKGLVDPKLGDDALDRAFLIEGDIEVARRILAEPQAALRIAGRGGTIGAGDDGVFVEVDAVPAEDEAVLELVVACIATWRESALAFAGFGGAAPP